MTHPAQPDASARDALDRLIREEWPKLRRFFQTKVPSADVYDLAQTTLLAFVEAGEVPGNPKAYLWGIARKQALRYFERMRASVPFDSASHGVLDAGRTLSSRLGDRHRLVRALQALPADQQIALELRHGEELSLEEVAAALGVSLATAKRYLGAGEHALRANLGADVAAFAAAYRAS